MNDKIKILLDKIEMDESSYSSFSTAKITKIKVNKKKNSWLIYIDIDNLPPEEIYEELQSKKHLLDKFANNIEFVFNIKNFN